MRNAALVMVVLAASLSAGCNVTSLVFKPAVMFADTLTDQGDGFTLRSPQWAYEGEKVTLDFFPDMSVTDYAVFTWPDGRPDVLTLGDFQEHRCFRGAGTFKAGQEPRHNKVRATAYSARGKPDWYYDKDEKRWTEHRPAGDEPDIKVGSAEMEIICYRVTVEIEFQPGNRQLSDAVLHILKGDGTRTSRRIAAGPTAPGFELRGPDAKGGYVVRYTPTHPEVNRTGKTNVELVLSFKDGTQETVSRTIDTP